MTWLWIFGALFDLFTNTWWLSAIDGTHCPFVYWVFFFFFLKLVNTFLVYYKWMYAFWLVYFAVVIGLVKCYVTAWSKCLAMRSNRQNWFWKYLASCCTHRITLRIHRALTNKTPFLVSLYCSEQLWQDSSGLFSFSPCRTLRSSALSFVEPYRCDTANHCCLNGHIESKKFVSLSCCSLCGGH